MKRATAATDLEDRLRRLAHVDGEGESSRRCDAASGGGGAPPAARWRIF